MTSSSSRRREGDRGRHHREKGSDGKRRHFREDEIGVTEDVPRAEASSGRYWSTRDEDEDIPPTSLSMATAPPFRESRHEYDDVNEGSARMQGLSLSEQNYQPKMAAKSYQTPQRKATIVWALCPYNCGLGHFLPDPVPRPEPLSRTKDKKEGKEWKEWKRWKEEYRSWRDFTCSCKNAYFCRAHGQWVSGADVRNGNSPSRKEQTPSTCHKLGYFCKAHQKWIRDGDVVAKKAATKENQTSETCHRAGYFCKAHNEWVPQDVVDLKLAPSESNQTESKCHPTEEDLPPTEKGYFNFRTSDGCNSKQGISGLSVASIGGSSSSLYDPRSPSLGAGPQYPLGYLAGQMGSGMGPAASMLSSRQPGYSAPPGFYSAGPSHQAQGSGGSSSTPSGYYPSASSDITSGKYSTLPVDKNHSSSYSTGPSYQAQGSGGSSNTTSGYYPSASSDITSGKYSVVPTERTSQSGYSSVPSTQYTPGFVSTYGSQEQMSERADLEHSSQEGQINVASSYYPTAWSDWNWKEEYSCYSRYRLTGPDEWEYEYDRKD
ncbi:hypothetical protein G7Y89_g12583 [Cudoniella acicularis]|uniref:Uncharacterized protein n=1 Tax=Cudoniella acicularis TaxID=354080 RepID=A0A8H4RCB6_9HELO|nr:hypothetical protein G7Y89_g12583 [Cudoniella acicularis]